MLSFLLFLPASASLSRPIRAKGPAVFYKEYIKLHIAATNECAPKIELLITKVPCSGPVLRWQAAGLIQI